MKEKTRTQVESGQVKDRERGSTAEPKRVKKRDVPKKYAKVLVSERAKRGVGKAQEPARKREREKEKVCAYVCMRVRVCAHE